MPVKDPEMRHIPQGVYQKAGAPCPDEFAPASGETAYRQYPTYLKGGSAHVLVITSDAQSPAWFKTHGINLVDAMDDEDIVAVAVSPDRHDVRTLSLLVDDFRPLLVINQALIMDCDSVVAIAAEHPETIFLNVCHSSLGDLARSDEWMMDIGRFLSAARLIPNVMLGHADERNPFGDTPAGAVHLPNIVNDSQRIIHLKVSDVPVVSLICSERDLKNIPTQLVALARFQHETSANAIISFNGPEPEWLRPFCDGIGLLQYSYRGWTDHDDYMAMVQSEVTLGLQVSYTESFNYVGIEHMLCGIPVIVGPSIRYGLHTCIAKPNDVPGIVRCMMAVKDCRQEAPEFARRRAKAVILDMRDEFTRVIAGLLGHPVSPTELGVGPYYRGTKAFAKSPQTDTITIAGKLNPQDYAPPKRDRRFYPPFRE